MKTVVSSNPNKSSSQTFFLHFFIVLVITLVLTKKVAAPNDLLDLAFPAELTLDWLTPCEVVNTHNTETVCVNTVIAL